MPLLESAKRRLADTLGSVATRGEGDCHAIRRRLEERFEIEHTTLQVDHARERELLSIEPGRREAQRGGPHGGLRAD